MNIPSGILGRMIQLLAQFPTLFPDELLYSGIARYHLISGNSTQKQTVGDLFGERLACATIDLPSHLNQLSDRIGALYPVDKLIGSHTLLPYYKTFMTEEKALKITTLMSEGSTSGEVHASLGLIACLIKSPKYLKFCMTCYVEDISYYNEPYWHRSHQIPGVCICHIHKDTLIETRIYCSSRNQKFEFVPLVRVARERLNAVQINTDWRSHLLLIAELSSKLIGLGKSNLDPNSSYKTLLIRKDYITPAGRVRIAKLISYFCEFFSDDLLCFLRCNINSTQNDTWIHKIVRGREEVVLHPLRHLLMHIFLGLEFNEQLKTESPFGAGPWPCLNKATEHYNEYLIDSCKITRCSSTGKPIGTFGCSCGFVYSRRGPDKVDEDRFRIGRIKSFGNVWVQRLIQLNQRSMSLREKARILGVDPGTVKKRTDQIINYSQRKESMVSQEESITRRGRFINSVIEAKTKNISVQQLNAKDYSWLYRHDRRWLFKVISDNRCKQVKHSIIDWQGRDDQLLQETRQAINTLKNVPVPQRITIAAVGRHVNPKLPFVMNKCLNKLTRTKAYLDEQIETTNQFQLRRIEWAAEKLETQYLDIQGWKLLKSAGLNKPLKSNLEVMFNNLTAI